MTMHSERGSAKIYQFPTRGRFAANERGDATKPSVPLAALSAVNTAGGGGWYHDEAIREAEQARKN